ncbi:oligosaccharide flippase family protein [Klebsiella quasipneumoniae subsp. similipneumoniae]|uniref:oligosaccharide flippase family protein n=1 Tax=Klebsiella TaxID=570 RepID=UPI0008FF9916|nr:oligosaccharide flippase family protein [Klebsiella quasipneumoniae]HDH1514273.1 oligosaccharide flippase family protein [Klebsiella quasipneumoniae subsp. similipneumoniae]
MNKKILFNSIWMVSEKIVSIFGLFFVTSFVAKYVGPYIYGEIAYVSSLFQITLVIAQLGSDVIIFKRLSKNKKSGIRLLKTTVPIRIFIYSLVSIPIVILNFDINSHTINYFIIASFFACLFSSLDVYSIYYNVRLESKKNAMINVVGLVISLIIRWVIAYFKLPAETLSIPIVVTTLIPFILRSIMFNRMENDGVNINRRKVFKYSRYLLLTGMTFVISAVSVAIYTRLSIWFLDYFYGKSYVGIFSIAVSLASSWSFVLLAIITSSFPQIFSENKDLEAIRKAGNLGRVILVISIFIIIFIYLIGGYLLQLLYGEKYSSSFEPLIILSISTMVSSLGVISSRFIAKYSGYSYLAKKTIVVLFLSACFNYYSVKYYGMQGAAWATLATELFSLTVLNYFFKHGIVFKVHKNILFRTSSKVS